MKRENFERKKKVLNLYQKYFEKDTLIEFYGSFAFEVLNGDKILPLSKKFFMFIEKMGLPKEVVEEIALATLSYVLDRDISKDVLEKARTVPHVKELEGIENIFNKEELEVLKKRKRCPLFLEEKVEKHFGIEPLVRDYAEDYYRWLNGEFNIYPL